MSIRTRIWATAQAEIRKDRENDDRDSRVERYRVSRATRIVVPPSS